MKGSLRREFTAIVGRAAEAGFPCPSRLFSLTPLEIEWELAAFAAQRRLEMERLDDLAWLVGRYACFAVNAPGRYPRRPDGVVRRVGEMTDAQMKAAFLAMAGG